MEDKEYLIDTNVLIEFAAQTLTSDFSDLVATILDRAFYLSIINKIELLGFQNLSSEEETIFNRIVDTSMLLPITEEIADETIRIRRKYKIKLPDALIAATCIVHNLVLITRNSKDFRKVDELELVVNV